MKTVTVLCFSDRGSETAGRISQAMKSEYETRIVRPGHGQLSSETKLAFSTSDALIFVSSCGIAVRAIAPLIQHKSEDPAVLVCDERGIHVISLLSGHIGGANELTLRIADAIGAEPVITTATDIGGRFSADAWAAKHGLFIDQLALVKRFSAEILKRDLPLVCDFPVCGTLPAGLSSTKGSELGAIISVYNKDVFDTTLKLVPRAVHFGIGCKRDTPAANVRSAMDDAIARLNLHPKSIADISSIDVKANEPGLITVSNEREVPFRTYSAETLNSLPGTFSSSGFVHKTVGVDCVCERAAMMSAGPGARLILSKTKYDGVTCAAAIEDWRATFE